MRLFSRLTRPPRDFPVSTPLAFLFLSLAWPSQSFTFTPVPPPDLDLSQLGHVVLTGDFDGISLYQFEGQTEGGFSTNGSQSILTRFPDGGFASLASADAGIQAMCSFTLENGTAAGVVVGGNFTSLGGKEAQGVALFNPNTSSVTPLTGLSGQVYALYCDNSSNTVYVGGSFRGANSTNALAWVEGSGWTNLPFSGFNGPVTSISKASNGHIIFGGSFTGLGNVTGPNEPDQQVINLSSGNITASPSSLLTGFSDPTNILCKNGSSGGSGETWLLADKSPGFWKANFRYGFEPTKLRLQNTHQDGHGTKTWRFTAFPINGIMNFTYIDPITGSNSSCTSQCPLSNDPSIPYQDFYFVNVIGMDGFQIDISDSYGNGGGLDGIQLFQNDIFAYAVNAFNEPACANISTASRSTATGPWKISPSLQSQSEFLTAKLSNSSESASVVFFPDIRQSGNYSVNIYTPGCIQDNTCSSRGQVNITGIMASDPTNSGFQTQIFQTNNFDKYDQIYFGYIEAASSSFRPSVQLSPVSGQSLNGMTVVAHRVGFTLISSTGGIKDLFEYDPTKASVDTADLTNSTINKAGISMENGSGVNVLASSDNDTFVGGNFTTSTSSNIFAVNASGTKALSGGGLNGEVTALFLNSSTLYVGGQFSNTKAGGTTGLNNIAAYDISTDTWRAIGAGLNGRVTNIVPLSLNVTASSTETVITFTGEFTEILSLGNNSIPVTGFAVWVPSQNDWLQNIRGSTAGVNGALTASTNVPGAGILLAGSVTSSQLGVSGAVALSSELSPLPVDIQRSQSQPTGSLAKRAATSQNVSGVVTGLFYENGNHNITILGGHFTATASNGSQINNLVFIDGADSNSVTGIGPSLSNDSTILAMAIQGDTLYAGGTLTGSVNNARVQGLISFNLQNSAFNTQPPALSGNNDISVNTISVRPGSSDIYVGGSFTSAGSLSCPAICVFGSSSSQWSRPGSSLGGIANTMMWASTTSLIVGGSLVVNGNNVPLATYNSKSEEWATATGATDIPGPVTALTTANSDASQYWVGGSASNGSAFLAKFDGHTWNPVGYSLGQGTVIRGLQMLSLTDDHDSTDLVPAHQVLLITGLVNVPGFGNASAVLYNGTTFQPFILTTTDDNTPGSLSQLFSQRQMSFSSSGHHLAKGFVVLIGLAIALGLIFLLVLIGVFAERMRRRREGYMPAPTSALDRQAGISRIPPEKLFGSLAQGRAAGKAPMI
ncbi:cortical protein marker for cell polarity-domain-containing protein [Xylogone sp. PMI_703]|nr:cortical protein marker for cell polarity-domain-containing protein [Xylogone sp. PMI_703]